MDRIRNIVAGFDAHAWAVVEKTNRGVKIVASGIGSFCRDNLSAGQILVKHDRNERPSREEMRTEIGNAFSMEAIPYPFR